MISQKLRTRALYAAASLFLAWHTLAMVIAPVPDSYLTDKIRVVLQPYMTSLRLDNQWDFFAPVVALGSILRYDIQDRAGKLHTFIPSRELSYYSPTFLWVRSWYYRIIDDPDNYAEAAGAFFCRKHADMKPLAITFYEIREEPYDREDYLSGKQRMDQGFFAVEMLRGMRCPNP